MTKVRYSLRCVRLSCEKRGRLESLTCSVVSNAHSLTLHTNDTYEDSDKKLCCYYCRQLGIVIVLPNE